MNKSYSKESLYFFLYYMCLKVMKVVTDSFFNIVTYIWVKKVGRRLGSIHWLLIGRRQIWIASLRSIVSKGVEFMQTKWLTSPERSLSFLWKNELWHFDKKWWAQKNLTTINTCMNESFNKWFKNGLSISNRL